MSIRYVCLSDLHLGEEDSLLSDPEDFSRPSPVLRRLVEGLAEMFRRNPPGAAKPTLILAGDVLEFALSSVPQALTTFEAFLRSVMPPGGELFGEIIYIPGNHDHHVWQAAREAQYLNHLGRLAPADPLDAPWDTTKVMMDLAGKDRLVSGTATAIAHRIPGLRERSFQVLTAYPNFGVQNGSGRAVVFHHGHLVEDAYHFLSTLSSLLFPGQGLPQDVYTLENENSAWIDFLWSALGSSGRVGGDMETVFESTKDAASLNRITDTLAASIASNYPVPKWAPRILREWTLKAALHGVVSGITTGQERRKAGGDEPLSPETARGLRWYVDELLPRQFAAERVPPPESMSFVFGHTHKPFVQRRDHIGILNTGGWVVDAPRLQALHGAAAVLAGDDLSTVGVRLYNEGRYSVSLEEPVAPGAAHSAFYDEVHGAIRESAGLWRGFGDTVRVEVELRAVRFAERLRRRAAPPEKTRND